MSFTAEDRIPCALLERRKTERYECYRNAAQPVHGIVPAQKDGGRPVQQKPGNRQPERARKCSRQKARHQKRHPHVETRHGHCAWQQPVLGNLARHVERKHTLRLGADRSERLNISGTKKTGPWVGK